MKKLPRENPSDQVYSVVKSYAAKGTLLQKQALEGLAESKDLDDLATRLRATTYGDVILRVEKPYTTTKLEMAFQDHLASIHNSLTKVASAPGLIEAYYLKYITSNLKTVLKGKALGKGYEELSRNVNLYPEQLIGRRDMVIRALSAGELPEVVNILRDSEFGDEIDDGLKAFRETGRPQAFDVYLDKTLYTMIVNEFFKLKESRLLGLAGSDFEKVKPLVAVDIDSYNVLAVLRAKLWDLEPSSIRDLIIEPTFEVSHDVLKKMVETESVVDAMQSLTTTRYRQALPSGELTAASLGLIEEGFNSIAYKRASAPFLWDDFSLSLVLGIIKMKELEARNLSAIAFGVNAKIGFQAITSKLIVVK